MPHQVCKRKNFHLKERLGIIMDEGICTTNIQYMRKKLDQVGYGWLTGPDRRHTGPSNEAHRARKTRHTGPNMVADVSAFLDSGANAEAARTTSQDEVHTLLVNHLRW